MTVRPAAQQISGRAWRNRFSRLQLQMPQVPLALMPPEGQQARAIAQIDKFITHPNSGLGPATVVQIYRAAEQGYPAQQCDLFADIIEMDGHLRSAIEGRLLEVTGKTWSVSPAGDDKQSQIAAELCQHALEEVNSRELFAQTLAARAIGFSGTEIVWTRRDGDVVPARFVTVPYRRFIFDDADAPQFLTHGHTNEGIPLEPGRWVWAVNQTPFTHLTARTGLMRTATWYGLFKRWSWRDWMVYAEKFGMPLVMGRYEPGTPEEQIDELEDATMKVGEDGSAIMSKLAEIEIVGSQRGGDGSNLHAGIVHEANMEISKLITGATLLTEPGGKSSHALGTVHRGRAFSFVQDDASLAGYTIQRDLFKPLLRWNGLEGARTPLLDFHVEEEVDPKTRAEVRQIYHEMGLPLDTEQLYKDARLRPPPSDERTLAAPQPAVQPPGNQN